MKQEFYKEDNYIKAKKKVKAIRDFYSHLMVYIVNNIFISGIIIYGLSYDEDYDFMQAIGHFGVYSTWLFWGIGLFFHWLSVFGFKNILGRNWEEKKIKELMDKDQQRDNRLTKR